MTKCEIKHYKKLGESGAIPVVLEGMLEISRAGHAEPWTLNINWDDEVICAVDPTAGTVGIMTFGIYEWKSLLFIKQAYVKEAYRRQGIHSAMYEKAKEVARERGLKQVQGGIHINNIAMQAVAEKQGRTRFAVLYIEEIKQKDA